MFLEVREWAFCFILYFILFNFILLYLIIYTSLLLFSVPDGVPAIREERASVSSLSSKEDAAQSKEDIESDAEVREINKRERQKKDSVVHQFPRKYSHIVTFSHIHLNSLLPFHYLYLAIPSFLSRPSLTFPFESRSLSPYIPCFSLTFPSIFRRFSLTFSAHCCFMCVHRPDQLSPSFFKGLESTLWLFQKHHATLQ